MGQLDIIRKKNLISSPETVNADWESPSVSLDDREGEFTLSLKYESGISVNMKAYLQVSNDDVDYGDVADSEVTITDSSGTVIYDINGSGCLYARLKIVVISGSIDVVDCKYAAKQRH